MSAKFILVVIFLLYFELVFKLFCVLVQIHVITSPYPTHRASSFFFGIGDILTFAAEILSIMSSKKRLDIIYTNLLHPESKLFLQISPQKSPLKLARICHFEIADNLASIFFCWKYQIALDKYFYCPMKRDISASQSMTMLLGN